MSLPLAEVNPREDVAVIHLSAVNILGSWGNEGLGSEGDPCHVSQHPLQRDWGRLLHNISLFYPFCLSG